MQLLVTGLADATTRVTILASANSQVWSPSAAKFVPSAADAALVPVQCQQPGLGSFGTVNAAGLPQPVGAEDYKLLYIDGKGNPISRPQSILPPVPHAPAVVVVTGQVVNLGGA